MSDQNTHNNTPDDTREQILVIKFSALGDFILALGAMSAIRNHHPDAYITLLTTKPYIDLADQSGFFDEVKETRRYRWRELGAWYKLRKWLRQKRFARVYDLQMNDRSRIIYNLLPKSERPPWSGVIKRSPLCYRNPNWRDMHAWDRHVEVLKVAGIEDVPFPDCDWMDRDIDHYELKEPFVLMVPGSAPTRPDKRWPAMRYAGFARRLDRTGYLPVLIGTQDEAAVTERIHKACPEARNLTGMTSLFDVAALARRASGAIGNDTGPMHLIAMGGCPSMVLFSAASNPDHSAPRGDDVKVMQTDDLKDLSVEDLWREFTPIKKIKQAS